MPLTISFDLPLPPSVNKLTRANHAAQAKGRRLLADWKEAAGWEVKVAHSKMEAKHLPFGGQYGARFRFPASMDGDIDNRIKAALDLLVQMRVTPDDRWCRHLSIGRAKGVQRGRFIVRVWTLLP